MYSITYTDNFVTGYSFRRQFVGMAYNNRNTLLRMVEIQNLVLERKRHGITQLHVYETEVYPKYYISYATFNRYLSYPAKHELKYGRRKEEDKRQLSLSF